MSSSSHFDAINLKPYDSTIVKSAESKYFKGYTVSIFDDFTGEVLDSFVVNSTGKYNFTANDLAKTLARDPKLNDVYTIFVTKDGKLLKKCVHVNLACSGKVTPSKPTPTPKPAPVQVNEVQVSGPSDSLESGQSVTLTATALPENAVNRTITWSSSNTAVATVDKNGKVTAYNPGTAIIYAKAKNGVTGQCTVTVENKLKSIRFTQSEVKLETGKSYTNRVIFTPYNTSDPKTFTVSIEEGKDDVISTEIIGSGVKITAGDTEGSAKVTVSCGEFTAECTVTVENKIEVPDLKDKSLVAVTNYHTSLAALQDQLDKIEVAEGTKLTFEDHAMSLAALAGSNEQNVAVKVTDNKGKTALTSINVQLLTITGLEAELTIPDEIDEDVESDGIITEGSDKVITLKPLINWTGSDKVETYKNDFVAANYKLTVETAKNQKFIELTQDGNSYKIKALKKGKTPVTISLKDANGKDVVKSIKKNIQVVSSVAEIEKHTIEGAKEKNINNKTYYVVDDLTTPVSFSVVCKEGYKITWTSSDASVATIGKTVFDSNTYVTQAPIVIKGAGKTVLTATANDSARTFYSFTLFVKDVRPSVDDTVTVNKQSKEGETINILPSFDSAISTASDAVVILDKDGKDNKDFDIEINDAGEYTVVANATAKNGAQKATLSVKVDGVEEAYTSPLTIKVLDAKPTTKVTQTEKVKTFYTGEAGNGILTLNVKDANITGATLTGCDFGFELASDVNDKNETYGTITFKGTDPKKAVKKGTLKITTDEYADIEVPVVIKTDDKLPTLAASSAASTIYPQAGITSASVTIKNKTSNETIELTDSDTVTLKSADSSDYEMSNAGGKLTFTLKEGRKPSKPSVLTVEVKKADWSKTLTFTHKISCDTKKPPILKLSSGVITLNKNLAGYQNASTNLYLNGITEENPIETVKISAGNDLSALKVLQNGLAFTYGKGTLTVDFNDVDAVPTSAKGYAYKVLATTKAGFTYEAKLTIKVPELKPVFTVNMGKDKIDLLNNKTSMTWTPVLKNVTGTVTGVKLEGTHGHLFDAEVVDGKIVVRAKDDLKYRTKYNYTVMPVLEIENNNNTYYLQPAKPVKFAVTEGKTEIKANTNTTNLFKNTDKGINVSLKAFNSNKDELNIADVAIADAKLAKAYKLEKQTDGSYELTIKDLSLVKKNSKANIKLNVTLNKSASNEKPKTVMIKVAVK